MLKPIVNIQKEIKGIKSDTNLKDTVLYKTIANVNILLNNLKKIQNSTVNVEGETLRHKKRSFFIR